MATFGLAAVYHARLFDQLPGLRAVTDLTNVQHIANDAANIEAGLDAAGAGAIDPCQFRARVLTRRSPAQPF